VKLHAAKKYIFYFFVIISSLISIETSFKYMAIYDLSFSFNVGLYINEGLDPYKDFFLPYSEMTFRIISFLISLFGKNIAIVYIWIFISNIIFSILIFNLSKYIVDNLNTRYILTILTTLVGPYSGWAQFSYDADAFIYSLLLLNLFLSEKYLYNHKYSYLVGFLSTLSLMFKQNVAIFLIMSLYLCLLLFRRNMFFNYLLGSALSGILLLGYYLFQNSLYEYFIQSWFFPSQSRIRGINPLRLSDNNLVDFAIISICIFIALKFIVKAKFRFYKFSIFIVASFYTYSILRFIEHPVVNSIYSFKRETRPILVIVIFVFLIGVAEILNDKKLEKFFNEYVFATVFLLFYFLTTLSFDSVYSNDLFQALTDLRYFLFYILISKIIFNIFLKKNNQNLKIIGIFLTSVLIASLYSQGVNSFYAVTSIFVIFSFIKVDKFQIQNSIFIFVFFIPFFLLNFLGVNYEYFETPKIYFSSYDERFLKTNEFVKNDINGSELIEKYPKGELIFFPNSGLSNLYTNELYFNYYFQHDSTLNPYLFEDKNISKRYLDCFNINYIAISSNQQLASQKYLEKISEDISVVDAVVGNNFSFDSNYEEFYIFKRNNNIDYSDNQLNCDLKTLQFNSNK
jgi:hypothetical protein